MIEGLAPFHFLRPAWLLALAALPAWLWWWRRTRDAADPWRAACDPHLLPFLLQEGAAARSRLPQWLFGVGYLLAVLALAGPAFRQLPQPLSRTESALIVALDLSDRMRALDIKPDRLSRARFKIADLLKARREGQTALIAYAGDAFVVAPLTDDASSLADLLASLTPDTMPVGGQRADRAIEVARRLLHDAGFSRGDLLLVTDAVDARAQQEAALAAADGLRVSALGIGTAVGAPVSLPRGGFAEDAQGNVLLPRLDEPALRALADAGDGRYATLSVDASDLDALGLRETDVGAGNLRDDERTTAAYRDEGPWLLLALLPLAALGFRRGWLGLFAIALALPAPRADAFEWEALWKRADQRAHDALQSDQAARALQLARDPALRGSAAYREGDYAQAETAFATRGDATSHYNRGNALAKAQRYPEAIAAYDAALQLAPDMDDAHANRKAVEDFLAQQQQEQPQPKSESSPSENADDGEDKQGEPQSGESQDQAASKSSDGDTEQEQGEGGEPGEPSEQEAEQEAQRQQQAQQKFAEQMEKALQQAEQGEGEKPVAELDPREGEKQQAVEQWLRRVPDDPGGLLRRKFALEYERRRREGGGEPR